MTDNVVIPSNDMMVYVLK